MTSRLDQERRRRLAKLVRRHARRQPSPGAVPGTLDIDPGARRPKIRCHCYGPDLAEERDIDDPTAIGALVETWPVTWIDVDGLGDEAVLRGLAEVVSLHPLALEDVVNLRQRPKVETYSEHLFIVIRMVTQDDEEGLVAEQLSIFVGERFVLTFQGERPGDCLDSVRDRIRHDRGRLRRHGPDYLAYAIVDAVVDEYFPVTDRQSDILEKLELEAFVSPAPETPGRIQRAKSDLFTLRRVLVPMRDVVGALLRDESGLVTEHTKIYARDCHDHTHQLLDLVDANREIAVGLLDVYLSSLSNKMNDVMKLLTLIATIFIPLTFVAGVYGMNFDPEISPWNMPELKWRYGYPAVLGFMTVLGLALAGYFLRKGWLSRSD